MSEVNKKLGTLLKKERERQKIKIDDLSERLKITVPYLLSIEAGTTDGLPSELYFSLFAKSYAEALGIDYSRTVEAIKNDIEESADSSDEKVKNSEKKKTATGNEESENENQFLKKAGVVFGIIVGLFIIFLGVNKLFFNSETNSISNDNSTNSQPTEKSEELKKLEKTYNNYNWDNKEYKTPKKIKLTLTPKQESWSAVFADGDTAIYRILRVGRTYTAEANYRLIVSVGVPSAVTVKLNGQEVNLRDKNSKRIYKVLINQMNIDNFLNRNQDSSEKETTPKKLTQKNKTAPQPIVQTDDTGSVENSNTN